jgi:PAS domain S-box-containing protein
MLTSGFFSSLKLHIYGKTMVNALFLNDERYRTLIQTAMDGFWLVDMQGNLLAVNLTYCQMSGYSEQELLAMSIYDLESSETVAETSAHIQHVIFRGQDRFTSQHCRKDGRLFCVEVSTQYFPDDGGYFVCFLRDITERIKTAETLHQSETTFKKLFSESSDAILLIDNTGVFVECNQAALDLLKMTRQQFLQLPPSQISPKFQPDGQCSSEAAPEMIALAHSKGLHRFDWTCVNSEGGEFIVEVSLMPIVIKGQTMLHTTWRDITERKKTEERLREAELKLRRTIEHSTNLFYTHTTDHVLTYLSPQSQEFFDYKPEEAMILWPEFLTDNPVNQEGFLTTQRAIDTGKRQPPYQVECIGKRGRKIWVEVNEAPILENGRTVAITGTLTDITERKKAEEQLNESEERFHKMFQDHDAVMLLIEPKTGQIIDANSSAVAFYGYPKTEFRKLTMHQINTLAPGIVTTVHDKVLSGKQTCFEFQHRLSSGEIRDVEVHISPIEIRNQTLFFSINHDVTQRKKLMVEQTRSAQLAALGTVAAGIAHEINNPIQGIMNYATLIKKFPDREERIIDMSQRIINESERITKLTKDLLHYSKDNKGAKTLIDVKETIESALSLMATKVRRDGVFLKSDYQEDLPQLVVQPQKLQQVIINLVDNANDALSYKPDAEQKKEIHLCTNVIEEQDGPKLVIEVSDNGLGMSDETIKKALEAFYSTKPSSEGTGLGLSIVDDIVKTHNGHIEIESKEGEYCKIKVIIPAVYDS